MRWRTQAPSTITATGPNSVTEKHAQPGALDTAYRASLTRHGYHADHAQAAAIARLDALRRCDFDDGLQSARLAAAREHTWERRGARMAALVASAAPSGDVSCTSCT